MKQDALRRFLAGFGLATLLVGVAAAGCATAGKSGCSGEKGKAEPPAGQQQPRSGCGGAGGCGGMKK